MIAARACSGRHGWLPGALVAALLLLTLAAYAGIAANGFVSYDDGDYLTANPAIRQGLTPRGLAWAFTTFFAGNWHPLTWLSHMLDVQLFGMRPAAHHLVNLGLHGAAAALLFLALLRLTDAPWKSAAVAALFAVHPLHVESVAWAAERKDVLSTLLAFAALLAYVRAVRRGGGRRPWAAALFLLALLAKPMPVTLPFVLLLLDWWPLGRWNPLGTTPPGAAPGPQFLRLLPPARLWAEKAPLFALAAASSAVTLVAQRRGGAMVFGGVLAPARRAVHVAETYWFYLRKTLWPVDLAVFYPYPVAMPPPQVWLAEVALLAGLTWALGRWARRFPAPLVGWLWFLGTLVPTIGLVQVGAQAWADRYSYLPLAGLFVAGVWGLDAATVGRRAARALGAGALAAALLGCAVLTRAQVVHWRDSFALYGHAIDATDGNWIAHNNYGSILVERGRFAEAAGHFRAALAARPDLAATWANLGDVLLAAGDVPGALFHYRRAAELDARLPAAQIGLGAALERQGLRTEAEERFAKAEELDPGNPDAAWHLARLRLRAGDLRGAAALLERALARDPSAAKLHTLLGEVLAASGRGEQAERHYRDAVRLSPDDARAHLGLGAWLAAAGRLAEAEASLSRAAAIEPDLAEAHYDLGKVLDARQRTPEAVRSYRLALKADPELAEAHNNLGVDLLVLGQAAEGTAHLREALRLKPGYAEARRNLELAGERR